MEIRLLNTQDDIMTQNNVMAVSHVYEESWKSTYKGLIPQDYLEQIPKGHWMQALKSGVWQSCIHLSFTRIHGKRLWQKTVSSSD